MIFITNLWSNPTFFFLVALSVVPSICLHEYMHAQTALWNGDATAAQAGHLTLNPLKQMGMMSLIMFAFIGIAWGAVPINPYNLSKKGRILTSLAGPLMNLAIFLIAWIGLFALCMTGAYNRVPKMLLNYIIVLGVYNILLCIFNLLPVPGLDGWNTLIEFIRVPVMRSELIKGVMLFLMLAAFLFFHHLYTLGSFLMGLAPALAEMLGR